MTGLQIALAAAFSTVVSAELLGGDGRSRLDGHLGQHFSAQ